MAFNGSQHFRIARPIVQPDFGEERSIAAHLTLTDKDSTYQFLTNTSGVTLDCILPAISNGLNFVIKNYEYIEIVSPQSLINEFTNRKDKIINK